MPAAARGRTPFRLALLLVCAASAAPASDGRGTGDGPPDVIHVPLHRRLAEAVANPAGEGGGSAPGRTRRYAVEADRDDGDGGPATLLLRDVSSPAVTDRTTYSFASGAVDPARAAGGAALLASDPAEDGGGGLTILSIDRTTGGVSGVRRERDGRSSVIASDGTHGRIRMRRAAGGEETGERRGWSCDVAHKDDHGHSHEHGHEHGHGDHDEEEAAEDEGADSEKGSGNTRAVAQAESNYPEPEDVPLTRPVPDPIVPGSTDASWTRSEPYSFNVDMVIQTDRVFIENQGGVDGAVRYINFLVSAMNVVFEHEIDTHLNVVHIEEKSWYDNLSTVREALKTQRAQPNKIDNGRGGITLYHAILGRYLGGGVAYIDSVCDEMWRYGITSDVTGRLDDMDDLVLFDMFIVAHEVGHSLGSGHTFDSYDPPVDRCDLCSEADPGATVEGLPRDNAATIMSYCNFCQGGVSNIALTLGGTWTGTEPRTDISNWRTHPDIAGSVSRDPRRVSHTIYESLSRKGCVEPPPRVARTAGCNDDGDCDDGNDCTVETCNGSYLCAVSGVLDGCCGNHVCEAGEADACPADCGPFGIGPGRPVCEGGGCHHLDGFMIDVALGDDAGRRVTLTSVSVGHKPPAGGNVARVEVYATDEGSYRGKETSPLSWTLVAAAEVRTHDARGGPGVAELRLEDPIPVEVGTTRGLYVAASERILALGEGARRVADRHGVGLYVSRAVAGPFGAGIDGFALDCVVGYALDDGARPPPGKRGAATATVGGGGVTYPPPGSPPGSATGAPAPFPSAVGHALWSAARPRTAARQHVPGVDAGEDDLMNQELPALPWDAQTSYDDVEGETLISQELPALPEDTRTTSNAARHFALPAIILIQMLL